MPSKQSSKTSKLYYTHLTGTDASYSDLFSSGVHNLQLEQMSLGDLEKTASGRDFSIINPKGILPCLVLSNGTVVNKKEKIISYIELYHAGEAPVPKTPSRRDRMRRVFASLRLRRREVSRSRSCSPRKLLSPRTPRIPQRVIRQVSVGSSFKRLNSNSNIKHLVKTKFSIINAIKKRLNRARFGLHRPHQIRHNKSEHFVKEDDVYSGLAEPSVVDEIR